LIELFGQNLQVIDLINTIVKVFLQLHPKRFI